MGFGDKAYELNIYSIEGNQILTEQHQGRVQIDIESFREGIYIVSLKSDGEETIRKFIKQ